LVALALLLLIGVQLYWVQTAYTSRQNQLVQQVNAVLAKAGQQTVDQSKCFELFGKVFIRPHEGIFFGKQAWQGKEQFVPVSIKAPDSVQMFFLNPDDTNVYGFNSVKFGRPLLATFTMKMEYQFDDTTEVAWSMPGYQPMSEQHYRDFKEKLIGSSPITKRLKLPFLDSTLGVLMAATVPGAPYHYGIIRVDNSAVEYFSKGTDPKKLLNSQMSAALNGDKYFSHPYRLALYLDNGNALALNMIWGILLVSALVILGLGCAFWYFIRTILTQEKLSVMKTDFINNMTHEFKTPITNIGLAVENINDKGDLNGSTPLLRIIGEENNRLRDNVERILQIATLEKDEINLKRDRIDVNGLVERISQNLELSNYPREPEINCDLEAENPYIMADETHVINVIYNLLDNALKYCNTKPIVKISTRNTPKGIVLTITDNGIGMDSETQKRVFEKFYRAHTGNIHTVKGFGLGLSYVKKLVELHQGTIRLESELGKGSTFEIFLPSEGAKVEI